MAAVDVGGELAAVRAALGGGDEAEGARVLAAVGRLTGLAEAVLAAAATTSRPLTGLLVRDDRLALEGLLQYQQRMRADGVAWPPATAAQLEACRAQLPRCWFGKSTEDGLPWMFCMTGAYALEVVTALERLVAALGGPDGLVGQGTT